MMKSLQSVRKQIDATDEQIVILLTKRAKLAQQVGIIKGDGPKYHPAREAEVLKCVSAQNTGPLPDAALRGIFTEIIAACRAIQKPLTVAYLGPEGTYSEEAARLQCGAASVYMPYGTIDETVRAAEAAQVDVAIVPIENTSEGAVNRTLDILLDTPLQIQAEILLPVRHQLLGKARNLEDIHEIHAHPQALAQCREWLAVHVPHAQQVAVPSNAIAAQIAGKNPEVAAIAGKRAAEWYKLPILAGNIEDDPNNTTRFIVLGTALNTPTGNDKTSLVWSVANQPGALQKALSILSDNNINMVKLESRPARNSPWEYMFYVDIEGHQDDPVVARAVMALCAQLQLVKVLGSYPRAVA